MDDLVERSPVRVADGLEWAVSGIAEAHKVSHLVAVGDAQDRAGFVLIPHRRVAGADPQVGGRYHHRHRGLTHVVLVGHLPAFTGRYWQDEGDRGRGPRDVTGSLPDGGKLLELVPVGDNHEVPGLAVFRRRRPPPGLSDTVQ